MRAQWSNNKTMYNLPLNALRAFAMVYETGGVRPAARRLDISHSSVSRHVKELEAWLGTPLLVNIEKQQRLQLTAQGQQLGKVVLASLGSIDHTVTGLREARRKNAVVIAATPSFAVRWLLPRLSTLQSACPSIEISIITEQALLDPMSEGSDISIRMGLGPWPNVESLALMSDALYPVVHPNLMKSISPSTTKEIFSKLPLLHDRDPSASWQQWFEVYPSDNIDLKSGSRFTSSDLVLRAASQQLGIALARARLVADDILSGALIKPFGAQQIELGTSYWIVTPIGGAKSWAIQQAIDWLQNEGVTSSSAP